MGQNQDMVLLPNVDSMTAPRDVEFRFKPTAAVARTLESVAIVGGFNGWDKARDPMRRDENGEWHGTVQIAPGVYPYLFVLNGNQWVPDPLAPKIVDLNSNVNSKLIVRPLAYDALPGAVGDGHITREAIRHRPTREDTVRRSESGYSFTLRTRANDVQKVMIEIDGGHKTWLKRVASDELFDTWRADLRLNQHRAIRYRFEIVDGSTKMPLPESGTYEQNVSTIPLPSIPDWIHRTVFYQIFPDRFADGDPTNDVPERKPWDSVPAVKGWQGGDLAGVQAHVDHLRDLGVNAVYLNPIFHAASYHAYDTIDYFQIDPHFGTNSVFKELSQTLHQAGMKVMLDGVFNHTNTAHPFFQDVIKNEARSPYANWYTVYRYPIEVREGQQTYRGWAGVTAMPKLSTWNPEVQAYVAKIGAFWIQEAGIDAWRLDVADEVDPECWRVFRRAVRAANPEAYILGEAWADPRPWVQGDQHDATMNYQWRQAVLEFFRPKPGLTARAFDLRLRELRDQLPEATVNAQFNLLGSHDTPRILNLLGGSKDSLYQALAFLMFYSGVPSIYYGDEIGMEGGSDPDCRRGMIWDRSKWDMSLYETTKALVHLRRSSDVLAYGSIRTLATDSRAGLIVMERTWKGQRMIGIWNTGKSRVAIKDAWKIGTAKHMRHATDSFIEPGGVVIYGNEP